MLTRSYISASFSSIRARCSCVSHCRDASLSISVLLVLVIVTRPLQTAPDAVLLSRRRTPFSRIHVVYAADLSRDIVLLSRWRVCFAAAAPVFHLLLSSDNIHAVVATAETDNAPAFVSLCFHHNTHAVAVASTDPPAFALFCLHASACAMAFPALYRVFN
jgi:hypothetical protein